MSFQTVNGVKDIQVVLQEGQVYSGGIDGVWGAGSANGVLTLLQDYHLFLNGGRSVPLPVTSAKGFDAAVQGVKDIQSNLKLVGLYTGAVDGITGAGSLGGLRQALFSYSKRKQLPFYDLGWSTRVPAAFTMKVRNWCTKQNMFPGAASALMACMCFESGGTFRPDKQNNGGSNYFGLIQFGTAAVEDLAKTYGLKITLNDVKAMSQLDQLDLVFKYFEMWQKRGKVYKRLEDFYLTIFYPAAVGKGPDEVLFTKDSPVPINAKSYLQNSGFDVDKDGDITVGEICTRLYDMYYQGMAVANRTSSPSPL
jgi:hypothetical protein